jgi:hypothetical protein
MTSKSTYYTERRPKLHVLLCRLLVRTWKQLLSSFSKVKGALMQYAAEYFEAANQAA